MSLPTPTPFNISVSDDLLAFINDRVRTARFPTSIQHSTGDGWTHGLPIDTLTSLQTYWTTKYNWRATEARINATFKQYTLPISHSGEDLTLHFAHHRSQRADAIPLLFIHGWPGSFLEVEKLLPLLTTPSPHQQAFHIIAPSLPGFGFSSPPRHASFTPKKIAAVLNALMLALGYHTYIVQGGDWGSMMARLIALNHDACVGVHVNFMVASPPTLWNPLELAWLLLRWFSAKEKAALQRMRWWLTEEAGYSRIMGTKPMTMSYPLVDSPVGMLAWIREKLESLVDGYVWSEEEAITWAMMYIIPGTCAPANLYKDGAETLKADLIDHIIPSRVYFGVSCFPKDVMYVPQWWARCSVAANIVFWREHERGGHFASVENPEVLVDDVRCFVERIQGEAWAKLVNAGAEQ